MTRAKILDVAKEIVTQDRNAEYGEPEDLFQAVSVIWQGLDMARGTRARGPMDVALYLDALKSARCSANPDHLDSWIDKCGYSACGGEIAGLRTAFAVDDPSEVVDRFDDPMPLEDVAELVEAAVAKAMSASTAGADDDTVVAGAAEPEAVAFSAPIIEVPAEPSRASVSVSRGSAGAGAVRSWSASDDKRLLQAVSAGRIQKEIAREMGRSLPSIKSRLKTLRDNDKAQVPVADPAAPAPARAAVHVPKPAPKPALAFPPTDRGLSSMARRMVQYLVGLDDNFAPEDDLALAEGLLSGRKLDAIAFELGCSVRDARARWHSYRADWAVDGRGLLTLAGQAALLAALRWRVAELADAKAGKSDA